MEVSPNTAYDVKEAAPASVPVPAAVAVPPREIAILREAGCASSGTGTRISKSPSLYEARTSLSSTGPGSVTVGEKVPYRNSERYPCLFLCSDFQTR
jgi:hypothetical protein